MNISKHETEWLQSQGAEMLQKLGIKEGVNVVDFGCGEGRYVIPLTNVVGKNGKVYAIEHIDSAIAVIKERMSIFTKNNNLEILKIDNLQVELPLQKNTIDAILIFDALQYIENWDNLFCYFFNALKSDGQIFIYPAAIPHPGDIDMGVVKRKMDKAGFKYIKSHKYTMMHATDIVDDIVYAFCVK